MSPPKPATRPRPQVPPFGRTRGLPALRRQPGSPGPELAERGAGRCAAGPAGGSRQPPGRRDGEVREARRGVESGGIRRGKPGKEGSRGGRAAGRAEAEPRPLVTHLPFSRLEVSRV